MKMITESDVIRLLPMSRAIEVVEQAFIDYTTDMITVGKRGTLDMISKGHSCLFLPAVHEKKKYFTLKYAASFPSCAQKGLPTVQCAIWLFSAETGQAHAMIQANKLTGIKTGATSAVATRYLANQHASILTIIGAGEQAKTQLAAISRIRQIKEVRLVDLEIERCNALKQWAELNLKPQYPILAFTPDSHLIFDADIIVTCTTSSRPVLMGENINQGTHINAIGAFTPEMQEIDENTVVRADKIVADSAEEAWKFAGDLIVPHQKGLISNTTIICELGDIILNLHPGRENTDEITVYKSVGFAPLDLAVAIEIYEKAVAD
jgi:ornithine cyclodeaminase/alanine dehydrogenase-like protein (mu-crystallin family)